MFIKLPVSGSRAPHHRKCRETQKKNKSQTNHHTRICTCENYSRETRNNWIQPTFFAFIMDEEHTAGYREPCGHCSAVDWGVSDEGRFYCKSCHNVIERVREVEDTNFTPGSARMSTISKGPRTKRPECGRQWMVCEGFQFILRNQANALLGLGVTPHFKDGVLLQLWRVYLQKSQQAYTHNPTRSSVFKVRGLDSDSDSAAESLAVSASDTEGETIMSGGGGSNAGSCTDASLWSGSVDGANYLVARLRRTRAPMSMKKTLALIHLALVWSREALTLSDLLRLVNEGHVPYVNAYDDLPDEMKLSGKDALIFRAESVPSHRSLHKEAESLLQFLQLPAFPPISRESLLHPALLSLRYLVDVNLPDELHLCVCRLMEHANMADQTFYTCGSAAQPVLPRYDMQTAALIIVTMKLMFGLDDHTEWDISNQADQDDRGSQFNLRRWYRLLQTAVTRARRRRDRSTERKQWKGKKLLHSDMKKKSKAMKKKRISQQVQVCFERLSSCPAGIERDAPCSFSFCWGDEDGADGPSMHQHTLGRGVALRLGGPAPCDGAHGRLQMESCLFSAVEAELPQSSLWLLRLFGFLLDVKAEHLYEEVQRVERRVGDARRDDTTSSHGFTLEDRREADV